MHPPGSTFERASNDEAYASGFAVIVLLGIASFPLLIAASIGEPLSIAITACVSAAAFWAVAAITKEGASWVAAPSRDLARALLLVAMTAGTLYYLWQWLDERTLTSFLGTMRSVHEVLGRWSTALQVGTVTVLCATALLEARRGNLGRATPSWWSTTSRVSTVLSSVTLITFVCSCCVLVCAPDVIQNGQARVRQLRFDRIAEMARRDETRRLPSVPPRAAPRESKAIPPVFVHRLTQKFASSLVAAATSEPHRARRLRVITHTDRRAYEQQFDDFVAAHLEDRLASVDAPELAAVLTTVTVPNPKPVGSLQRDAWKAAMGLLLGQSLQFDESLTGKLLESTTEGIQEETTDRVVNGFIDGWLADMMARVRGRPRKHYLESMIASDNGRVTVNAATDLVSAPPGTLRWDPSGGVKLFSSPPSVDEYRYYLQTLVGRQLLTRDFVAVEKRVRELEAEGRRDFVVLDPTSSAEKIVSDRVAARDELDRRVREGLHDVR